MSYTYNDHKIHFLMHQFLTFKTKIKMTSCIIYNYFIKHWFLNWKQFFFEYLEYLKNK